MKVIKAIYQFLVGDLVILVGVIIAVITWPYSRLFQPWLRSKWSRE